MSTATAAINLNPAQRAAVEHVHGPVLVIAGAGTGKTRVITERILYLLHAIPALEGENLLAITYTRKAAGEMAARLRRRGDKRAEKVGVFTFHAFCYELLRQHDEALKLLEPVDYWIFLRRRLDRLGLDLFLRLSEPGRFLNDFQDFFSRCQDELVSPDDYHRYAARLAAAFEQEKDLLSAEERRARELEVARQQELARVYAVAERLLREAQRSTFGGALFSGVELLRARPDLQAHYQERYRYILVDEFQDANIAQIELLALLAGRHRNLMAVGDDDQAIYRFRGASYASFRRFAELFPDRREITLTQNYRSTARILHVASTLIAQNGKARFVPDKRLRPREPGGEKVSLAEVDDAAAEAAGVVGEIQRRRQESGSYAGLAVLYRAHLHRRALVEALTRAGIPFVVRRLSILTRPLLRDLLAYLRAIDDPRDNVSLARLLALPAWGLNLEMLLDLVARAESGQGAPIHPERSRAGTRDRLPVAEVIAALHPRVRDEQTRLGALLALLAELRAVAARVPLTELFDTLLERIGLRLLPSDPDRLALDTFAAFLREWETEKSDTGRLAEFIEYFGYFEEAGGSIDLPEGADSASPEDAVQLMTVHAAKGLEFGSVFVLRLNRNEFPTRRRHPLFEFPAELMKEEIPPGDIHTQEERRLCYVALTRAQDRLSLSTLCGPRQQPSIFLEDILRDAHAARDLERVAAPVAASPPEAAAAQGVAPGAPSPALFATAASTSRIASWARRPAAKGPAEPLALSHSALETYLKCPLKYKFAHLWRLPGLATPAMVFGQIMHRSAVEYFRARRSLPELPLAELQHIYEQQWRETPWPFPDAYQREQYRAGGWQQLQVFHEQQGRAPASVLEMEKTFEWPWEDVVLTGRIDQINGLGGRRVEIIEYKTGQPRPARTVGKSLQLALYALAARHHLELEPQRLTLYNFTVNEGFSFVPDDQQARRALDTVRDVAAGIRSSEFPPRPGYHCRYCDYRSLCPAHEQPFVAEEESPPAAEGES